MFAHSEEAVKHDMDNPTGCSKTVLL